MMADSLPGRNPAISQPLGRKIFSREVNSCCRVPTGDYLRWKPHPFTKKNPRPKAWGVGSPRARGGGFCAQATVPGFSRLRHRVCRERASFPVVARGGVPCPRGFTTAPSGGLPPRRETRPRLPRRRFSVRWSGRAAPISAHRGKHPGNWRTPPRALIFYLSVCIDRLRFNIQLGRFHEFS